MVWNELSYRIGRLTADMRAVKAWQAKRERREQRIAILFGLGCVAVLVNLSPEQLKLLAEILGAVVKIWS